MENNVHDGVSKATSHVSPALQRQLDNQRLCSVRRTLKDVSEDVAAELTQPKAEQMERSKVFHFYPSQPIDVTATLEALV